MNEKDFENESKEKNEIRKNFKKLQDNASKFIYCIKEFAESYFPFFKFEKLTNEDAAEIEEFKEISNSYKDNLQKLEEITKTQKKIETDELFNKIHQMQEEILLKK